MRKPVHARPRTSVPSMIETMEKENHAPPTRRPRRTSAVNLVLDNRPNGTSSHPHHLLSPGDDSYLKSELTLTSQAPGSSSKTKKMNSKPTRRPVLGTRNVSFSSPVAASIYEPTLSSAPRPTTLRFSSRNPLRPKAHANPPSGNYTDVAHSLLLSNLSSLGSRETANANADVLDFLADASSRAETRTISSSLASPSSSSDAGVAISRPAQLTAPSSTVNVKRKAISERQSSSTNTTNPRNRKQPVRGLVSRSSEVQDLRPQPAMQQARPSDQHLPTPTPTTPPHSTFSSRATFQQGTTIPEKPLPPLKTPSIRRMRSQASIPPIIATPGPSPAPSITMTAAVPPTASFSMPDIPVLGSTAPHRLQPPSPLSTIGLPARRHATQHGDVEVLPRGFGLMVDLRKSERRAGRAGNEVLRISEEGGMVRPT